MPFKMTRKVDYVESPDVAEMFKAFSQDGQPGTPEQLLLADQSLRTGANIYLTNQIVTQALKKAPHYGAAKRLKGNALQIHAGRSVVILDRVEAARLSGLDQLPEGRVFATPDSRMDGKVIVIELNDLSHLAEYSFGPKEGHVVDEGCVAAYEMRIKFNLDWKRAVTYQRKK